jgi:preprotein translocase subunit SecB
MKVQQRHFSGINFDWVVVRELRFADNLQAEEFSVALADLGADVQVESKMNDARTVCRTTVRLSLSPPASHPDRFQVIAAAVEGQFSVAEGAKPSVNLDAFANRQAPAILMPFVREAIADATSKSRFGQVLIPPINVIALMDEIEKARQASALAPQPTSEPTP